MRHWSKTVLYVVSVAATPAGAADQLRIPTAKWVVDFADHQCVASREYGSAEKPLVLALKPSPMGDVMQIAILRKASFLDSTVETPVTIRIDDQAGIKSSLLAYSAPKAQLRSFRLNLPLTSFVPMRQATSVSISAEEIP